jgi:hypothetical protein
VLPFVVADEMSVLLAGTPAAADRESASAEPKLQAEGLVSRSTVVLGVSTTPTAMICASGDSEGVGEAVAEGVADGLTLVDAERVGEAATLVLAVVDGVTGVLALADVDGVAAGPDRLGERLGERLGVGDVDQEKVGRRPSSAGAGCSSAPSTT